MLHTQLVSGSQCMQVYGARPEAEAETKFNLCFYTHPPSLRTLRLQGEHNCHPPNCEVPDPRAHQALLQGPPLFPHTWQGSGGSLVSRGGMLGPALYFGMGRTVQQGPAKRQEPCARLHIPFPTLTLKNIHHALHPLTSTPQAELREGGGRDAYYNTCILSWRHN